MVVDEKHLNHVNHQGQLLYNQAGSHSAGIMTKIRQSARPSEYRMLFTYPIFPYPIGWAVEVARTPLRMTDSVARTIQDAMSRATGVRVV